MKREYPNICRPLNVCGLTLRNRMCSAPMGATDITAEGTPGPRTQGFYEARAKGGAAIVTVSELVVHPQTDGSQMLRLSLSTPNQLGAFTYVADAIKRHGALASIELSHSGQYAGTYMVDEKSKSELCKYGPSDGVRPDGVKVKALTKEQINAIAAAYGEKAALARRAGFDMVMVHCGHGWLINQFLSPFFNHRQDEYGGSFEGRIRFAREVLTSVRKAMGQRVPIEMRMSGSELFEGGYDLDEGIRIACALEDLVDIIHVSAGSYQFGFSITHPSMFRPHGCNVYLAREIKKHVSKPVATLGGLSDPCEMEDIIARGDADLVVMGRALLADPELPNKVMANRGNEVLHCLRCYTCMAERPMTQTRRCAINPRIGREIEGFEVSPVLQSARKKVLVAGGGIAGMVAARTAAQRGHEVTLCEASSAWGGILRCEQSVPFKHDMYRLSQTYAALCEEAGVTMRLNTLVDAAFADAFAADAVIVAVGSAPRRLRIPLEGSIPVYTVEELYLENAALGQEIAIIGGGLTGCECALHCWSLGKRVHLISNEDGISCNANIRQRPIIRKEIEESGVEVMTNTAAVSVEQAGVAVQRNDGTRLLVPCDTVISAIGQVSRTDAVDALRDAAPFVRVVGDAVRARTITDAVYEGFHAALDI